MQRILVIITCVLIIILWWYWPYINFYAGNYYYNNYRSMKAIDAFTQAINSNRLHEEFLGKSYFGRGQSKIDLAYVTKAKDEVIFEALQDYNKAISIIPDNPFYYRERGAAYSYLGGYEEAFQDFEKIREYENGKPMWSLVRKGGLEKRLGNYEEAISNLKEVIDAWSPIPLMPPNYHLALTYLELEQYEDAIGAINEGEKAQTDYGSAYQIRACAEANLGHFDLALSDYEKAVAINKATISETYVDYPSYQHNKKIETEELAYLKSLAQNPSQADNELLKKMCFQNWWQLYFDNKRERSRLL